MSDIFGSEEPAAEEQSLIHKKKAKFDALRARQKKLKEKAKARKAAELPDGAEVDGGSSDDSEDEYVGQSYRRPRSGSETCPRSGTTRRRSRATMSAATPSPRR